MLHEMRASPALAFLVASVVIPSMATAAGRVATERVSVDSSGAQFVGDSFDAAVSSKGRFVAFESDGVPFTDVLLRDRKTGVTTLVSNTSDGSVIDAACSQVCISANGRFVAFQSQATRLVGNTLVPEDTNGVSDVFVHDTKTAATRRVSVATGGAQANGGSSLALGGLSANGRYVVFRSSATNLVSGDTNQLEDVFLHDLKTRRTVLVSVGSAGEPADGNSFGAVVSANGRFVAFASGATNLVAGDGNASGDVFVRDLRTARTVRATVNSAGAESDGREPGGASISANGKVVAFSSDATTLVEGDTNGLNDVFVHDFRTGRTVRVSVASDGAESVGGASGSPSISANGKVVLFNSTATNLVPGDANQVSDVFVRDLKKATTRRISVGPSGEEGNSESSTSGCGFSPDGKFVVFNSYATNFTSGDSNGQNDVFLVSTK